jgi:membrane protein DedA with SNARE-associated domain
MIEQLDMWIASTGPTAFLVLGLGALIEYIFPPFPGDTVVILGGIYAVRGQKPWALVFAVITVGSVIGAAIDYWIGCKLRERIEHKPDGRFLGLSHQKIREVQEKMQRFGSALILINRFLPAVRAFIFLAAGAARLSFGRVLLLGAISAMAWNCLLMGLGIAVGGNVERVETLIRNYEVAVYSVLVIIALAITARFFQRRRQRRPTSG